MVFSVLAGCAFGNKHDYRQAQPSLAYSGAQKISVGVHDQRPEVVRGDVDEDYVGMQRGGYGNPFRIGTLSHKPLADEMAKLLVDALRKSGAQAAPVRLAPSLKQDQALSVLKAGQPDKSLLLVLRDWESDSYVGTELRYDVDMKVFGRSGNLLASKTAKGVDQLGSSFWNPQGVAKEQAPIAFRRKMEELYSGDIAKALNQTGETAAGMSAQGPTEDTDAKLTKLK
ncbi:MAG: hypothetical protein ACKN9W_07715 [Methylococcus sp.]